MSQAHAAGGASWKRSAPWLDEASDPCWGFGTRSWIAQIDEPQVAIMLS
jgi:hypothetical protein